MARNVALYYDPLFPRHDTLDHPERPERVLAALEMLEESWLVKRLRLPACRDATVDELARIHSPEHIDLMRLASEQGPVMLDPDTIANRDSYAAAVRAAGAVLSATEAVVAAETDAAFCLTRPPGHHATPKRAMGFCIFNSVAVAAAHARQSLGLERVAIVDPDLHHGNGTQDAFYNDGSVFYASAHQYPFYPGSGHWRETGEGEGAGATLNLSLPGGCGDAEYLRAFDEAILPALRRFRPQLILVSFGYDAHFADTISGAAMRISCAGYAQITQRLADIADELCGGRLVMALEGGYQLTALSWSIRNTIEVLLGDKPTPDPLGAAPERPAPDIDELLASVKAVHGLD